MKVCVVSDLHLEISGISGKNIDIKEENDVLIIAGDLTNAYLLSEVEPTVSNFDEFNEAKKQLELLERYWFSKFKKVYYVLGNHDHYGGVLSENANIMKNYFKKNSNIKVLDNEFDFYEDIIFIGSTLWTDFNKNCPIEAQLSYNFMNDYNFIYYKHYNEITYIERNHPNRSIRRGMIIPHYIYKEHQSSLKFIKKTLNDFKDKKSVVITHHAPSLRCQNTKRFGKEMIFSYCSNLEPLIESNEQIALWVSGHTHHNHDFMIGKTRLFSNQRGYPHEPEEMYFKPVYLEI